MAVVFSRRGFLGGVLASVSVAALPLPVGMSSTVQSAEPLAAPVVPQPFHIILDEVGYYMPEGMDLLANAFRTEPCVAQYVETELSEPTEVGRVYVAALKDHLAGRGMQQEAVLVRRVPHMATVI